MSAKCGAVSGAAAGGGGGRRGGGNRGWTNGYVNHTHRGNKHASVQCAPRRCPAPPCAHTTAEAPTRGLVHCHTQGVPAGGSNATHGSAGGQDERNAHGTPKSGAAGCQHVSWGKTAKVLFPRYVLFINQMQVTSVRSTTCPHWLAPAEARWSQGGEGGGQSN
jgi:hypothetical protein